MDRTFPQEMLYSIRIKSSLLCASVKTCIEVGRESLVFSEAGISSCLMVLLGNISKHRKS